MILAMGQERIELNKGKQSLTDVLGLEKIKITRHAWKQFYSRTGYDLGGKSYNLIERLKTAKIIEIDSKEIKHPFIKDKKTSSYSLPRFFRPKIVLSHRKKQKNRRSYNCL